ncbi:MAG TPA: UDP-N-acetylglucosamine 2-epimerase (non-hydrolyzing) [Gemmatimonadales bacterium]
MHLLHVVGARPNFPKLAPVHRAARRAGLTQTVVHTGQHYDEAMSASFFRELEIPEPDVNLEVGSASHAVQTARIMERIEPVLLERRPDWVLVYGDVNSTAAAALVAVKLGIRAAHVEAGLRSYDRAMPEEINRVVTDRIVDLLLTPSRDADVTLEREGVPAERIAFVGNVMIDSLFHALRQIRLDEPGGDPGVEDGAVVVTLHRPSNVDDPARLAQIAAALREIATERSVVFPVHPRTRQRLEAQGLDLGAVRLLDPIPYREMLAWVARSHAVVTDSGGLQEETTALGVPCFTVRENTERPITIVEGTNQLVRDLSALPRLVRDATRPAEPRRPEGWDGNAGDRVVEALRAFVPPVERAPEITAAAPSATS